MRLKDIQLSELSKKYEVIQGKIESRTSMILRDIVFKEGTMYKSPLAIIKLEMNLRMFEMKDNSLYREQLLVCCIGLHGGGFVTCYEKVIVGELCQM